MTDKTLTPGVVKAPPSSRGRPGKQLPEAYVAAVADALKGIQSGEVVSTGETYDDKAKARKAVELLRRELVRLGHIESSAFVGSRIWEDNKVWIGGVTNRTPSED